MIRIYLWGRSAISYGADMDVAQELSQPKENLAGEVMESLGVEDESTPNTDVKDELPLATRERLGKQEKRHKKEMRLMQDQLARLQAQLGASSQPPNNDYSSPNDPYAQSSSNNVQDHIKQAVMMALNARDEQERKAREAESLAHVHRQYQKFADHLDNASDKYSDFDETVRSDDSRFTESMRDAAMILHNSGVVDAADLLYKLGKNKDELKKISELHPLEQASEMMRLGYAMANGSDKATSSPKPLGQIKTNPVVSRNSVDENTPISELRKRINKNWK